MAHTEHDTLVIEDGVIPRRVRRPVDLVRMVSALLAIVGVLAAATILLRTVSGIDADVADSAAKLPAILALLLTTISGLGQLVLPATIAVDLLSRRRGLLLSEAAAAAVLAALFAYLLTYGARDYGSNDLWFAVAGTKDRAATPLQPAMAAVFAYLTVARLRGWLVTLASVVMGSTLLANVISGGHTVAAQSVNVLIGYAIGLGFRYAFGTPTVRPRGWAIAQMLEASGYPIRVLRALQSTRHGRRYLASTDSGQRLLVVVFDRDLEGAGVIPRWWRSLRLKDVDALGGWKMREAIDRNTLLAHAALAAGAPVPQLLLVRAIGPDACVLANEWIEGKPFDEVGDLTDDDLRAAWRALAKLSVADIAHRAICPAHLMLDGERKVWMIHTGSGAIAMSDLQRRIDLANMLIALALVTDADRAVATGREVLGDAAVLHALPALQPFALSEGNRDAVKAHRSVISELRERVAALAKGKPVEQVSIERLSPRRLFSIVAGLVAAYLLVGQFANVDVGALLSGAKYGWLAWALLFTAITYVGAAMSLDGFVVEKLSMWRTFLAQLASSFATLVSPPALGVVAVNGRYLQREGLPAAAAGATVAVSQTIAFFIHIGLMFAAAVAAGSANEFQFDPPRAAVIAIGLLLLLILIALPVPAVRKFVVQRARPRVEEVIPRLVTVASRPSKLAEGIGGMLILNVGFCLTLYACVQAFDGGGGLAAISLVYLAGSTLGQAAPTPGGIGAVETVLTAGLVTAGVDGGIALSAVLVYRLITFWLPTIPGWLAFQHLTKRGSL